MAYNTPVYNSSSIKFLLNELLKFETKNQKLDNKIVKNLGGLYIIGTERNDSRRIDNQLRGRCGRQGDPGTSKFFLSLEDRLLRLFGGSSIESLMNNQFLDDSPLESKLLTKSLNAAQKRLEEADYESRKFLFEYDEVLNRQRNIMYYERRKILESVSAKPQLLAYGEQIIIEIVNKIKTKSRKIETLVSRIENLFGTELTLGQILENLVNFEEEELKLYLFQEFWLTYEAKTLELEIGHLGIIRALERTLILVYFDMEWKEHLQKMSLLRDSVGWRSYGQRNPLSEYKEEAYKLFKSRGLIIRHLIIYDFIRAWII